mmetsp:Transcript_17621/g.36817  ORF Transcript_17621/g.36817 Transcript_17621/m.36817 type:complete len:474 (-) Transcript_17621:176-1597(-)
MVVVPLLVCRRHDVLIVVIFVHTSICRRQHQQLSASPDQQPPLPRRPPKLGRRPLPVRQPAHRPVPPPLPPRRPRNPLLRRANRRPQRRAGRPHPETRRGPPNPQRVLRGGGQAHARLPRRRNGRNPKRQGQGLRGRRRGLPHGRATRPNRIQNERPAGLPPQPPRRRRPRRRRRLPKPAGLPMGRRRRPPRPTGVDPRLSTPLARRRRRQPRGLELRIGRGHVGRPLRLPHRPGGPPRTGHLLVLPRPRLLQGIRRSLPSPRRVSDGLGGDVPTPQIRKRLVQNRAGESHLQRTRCLLDPHGRSAPDEHARRADIGGGRLAHFVLRVDSLFSGRGGELREGYEGVDSDSSVLQSGVGQDRFGGDIGRGTSQIDQACRGVFGGIGDPLSEDEVVFRRRGVQRPALLRFGGVVAFYGGVQGDQFVFQYGRFSGQEDGVEVPSQSRGRGKRWRCEIEEEQKGEETKTGILSHHQW